MNNLSVFAADSNHLDYYEQPAAKAQWFGAPGLAAAIRIKGRTVKDRYAFGSASYHGAGSTQRGVFLDDRFRRQLCAYEPGKWLGR
jgi:hypothetical protein